MELPATCDGCGRRLVLIGPPFIAIDRRTWQVHQCDPQEVVAWERVRAEQGLERVRAFGE